MEPKNQDDSAEFNNLKNFKLKRILCENIASKAVFLLCTFNEDESEAIVILEKQPFNKEKISDLMNEKTDLIQVFHNDIYRMFQAFPPSDTNALSCTIIHPANQKHILKYTSWQPFLIRETYEDYKQITFPFFEEQKLDIEWVYNILEGRAEQDRVVLNDEAEEDGFVLVADMKWDQSQLENLYLVAICRTRNVKCLRDLTGAHIPMLRKLEEKCKKAIEQRYQVSASQFRVFVHYLPSYFHFHVHFTHIQYEAPGINCDRAHLLTDIIDNLSMDCDYYQKRSLSYVLKENHGLLKLFREKGRL